MLAITLHRTRQPTLSKHVGFLPIPSWDQAKPALRILRAADAKQRGSKSPYQTLVTIPETQLVAIVLGDAEFSANELEYRPLGQLADEDREILDDWLHSSENPPNLSSASASSYVRIIIGAPLPRSCVKWTKDIRLLSQGSRNPATKRT